MQWVRRVRRWQGLLRAAILVVGLAVGFMPTGRAQGGITNEGPLTVFRSGGTNALLTLSLPFTLPPTNAQPTLQFDFGFSTAEPDVPETFFDSFSITLKRDDQPLTALLLTADRTGVLWAPNNPGGLPLAPTDIQRTPTNFPALSPDLALKMAYSIAFAIPAMLAGGPATLFLDFFDNLNTNASLAFVRNVRIEAAVRPYRLLSAPLPGGPYAEETAAALDLPARTFTLPPPPGLRFFRVEGEQPTRIVETRVAGSQLSIRFDFLRTVLLSSTTSGGPYVEDPAFTHSETNGWFVGPIPSGPRYFELQSWQDLVISRLRVSGAQAYVEYEPVTLSVWSAPNVTGPFTRESLLFHDPARHILVVAAPAANRYYRLEGNARARIIALRFSGTEMMIDYSLAP